MEAVNRQSEPTAPLHRPLLLWSLPFAFLGFGLPIFSKELGATALEIGGLFSVFTAMTIIFRPVIGWAVDRFGRKHFFVIALLIYSLAMGAFSLASDLAGLYLARILQGIGASFLWISVNTMVADVTLPQDRGRAFGRIDEVTARGGLIGIFAGFFIISSMPNAFGWQITFTGYAALAFLGAGLAWKNVPETKPVTQAGTPQRFDLSWPLVALLIVVFIMSASEAMLGPIYLIFFVLSGAALKFSLLYTSGLILVGYIFARSLGKTVGPFLGGMISGLKFDRGKYLSMGFLSQSAIAIGLSLVGRDQYPEIGEKITAVVLGAVIFFEIVGPYLLKNLYQLSEEANQKKDDKLLAASTEEVSLTKIMVPIGTKPPSVRKVKIITGLAKKMNGQLLALNVRRFPAKDKYIPLNSAAEKALKIFKELVEKEEVQVEILIEVTEDVPDTICKTAVNEHIDLIIMGVSGRTGFLGRFGGGGVTQKVSGRIGCPVLIIPD